MAQISRHMVYEDYKKVALKKLMVCHNLVDSLSKSPNSREQDFLKRTIFYLGGYVIEGVVNYAVFRTIGYSRNGDIKRLNQALPGGGNISFFKRRRGRAIFISNHKFMDKLSILRVQGPSDFSNVPLIGDTRSHPRIHGLLRRWTVNFRYETAQTHSRSFDFMVYSKKDINDFVEVIDEVYKEMIRIF